MLPDPINNPRIQTLSQKPSEALWTISISIHQELKHSLGIISIPIQSQFQFVEHLANITCTIHDLEFLSTPKRFITFRPIVTVIRGERSIYFTKTADQVFSIHKWNESFTERYTLPNADEQETLVFVIGKRSGRTIGSGTIKVRVPPDSNHVCEVLNKKGKRIGRLRISFRPGEAGDQPAARPPGRRSRTSKIFSGIYKASMIGQAIMRGIEFFNNLDGCCCLHLVGGPYRIYYILGCTNLLVR
ncbi:hypothetical protein L2E82_02799 [Cichorium intybus]|uniref:Uncharacterized protein n=1 Tax=Cichorium intybus TaxID=13427 RepID=A0ACB9H2P0_CICIN|nr:hypothetical protein L2E82_02799 [Cichorium intybus]